MSFRRITFLIFASILFTFFACKKEEPVEKVEPGNGKIILKFTHKVNSQPLVLNQFVYVNAAGNPYQVDELMYFISDVTLHKADGSKLLIDDWKDIHYVDIAIPSTLSWEVYDPIPEGSYTALSFTFGISAAKNKSFMFVNPPEVNMAWPEILGGGYHYLMLNGKWKDTANIVKVFNFHLGIGQLYKNNIINTDSIIGYVHNYFDVTLPNSAFSIVKNQTRSIEIVMNIENWFKNPHIYDHNQWGGDIMQKQDAMNMIKENGVDVFSLGSIE